MPVLKEEITPDSEHPTLFLKGLADKGCSTIVANGQTYDFHILPSGLVNPKCLNLIGTGCVVHIPSFFKELEDLQKKGLDTKGRILLSDRAHVVFDLHLLIDSLQEGELIEAAEKEQSSDRQVVVAKKSFGGAIGTTKKGIGPAYSAKHARSGVRIHQIFNKEELDKRLRVLARGAQKRYGSAMKDYDVEAEIARFDVCLTMWPHYESSGSKANTNWHIDTQGASKILCDQRSTLDGQRTEE